ncbi:hypothetical protein R83H12_00800 [Fibrobacteria bacterium R8-3-H12]
MVPWVMYSAPIALPISTAQLSARHSASFSSGGSRAIRLYAVSVLLALVLVISCTEYKWDEWQAPESSSSVAVELLSSGTPESSSSASASSSSGISSSSELKSYCVYSEMKMCFLGSYSSCPGDGELSSFCPYMSSSSSSNSSQNGQSSSSGAVREYDYCVFILNNMCLIGPMSECPQDGTLSNSCPYNSSSSSVIPSSSSDAPIATSSSSIDLPSSSSVLPSSSDAELSSSSAQSSSSAESSSSSVLSSSSDAELSSSSSVSSSSFAVESSSSEDTPSSSSSSSSSAQSSSSAAESSSSEETPSSSSNASMCGESEYTPETQGCCNDSVYDLTRDGKAQFCDERDGKKYVYVSIGTQTWMAENLNYSSASSYNWATAMGLSSSCNTTACSIENHRGICPTGWHIPSDTEWTDLITLVGSTPGTKLKEQFKLFRYP